MTEPHTHTIIPISMNAGGKKARKARLRRLELLRLRSTASPADRSHQDPLLATADSGKPSDSSSLEEVQGSATGLLYGHVSVMGRRRVMEDTVTVAPLGWLSGEYSFFAVYDGHGGANVAEKCRDRMHKRLERLVDKAMKQPEAKGCLVWSELMADCFSTMDRELTAEADQSELGGGGDWTTEGEKMIGSTAMVVVVGKEELVVANCGDSRAVLCRDGAAIPLSRDHKPQPDRSDEKERIEAAGGKVLNWNGWRVQGVLATSRSLGDHCLKPYVTSEPEVTVVQRTNTDDFLIIATDGLFDVVPNELACELVKRYLNGGPTTNPHTSQQICGASAAAAALAELAMAKGSKDNISVIVVKLK